MGTEEIHFKLYKRYQKEEEILPFKNNRTALQKKKLKITGVLVKKKNKNNNNNKNHPQRVAESYFVGMAEIHFNPWEIPLYRYKWGA